MITKMLNKTVLLIIKEDFVKSEMTVSEYMEYLTEKIVDNGWYEPQDVYGFNYTFTFTLAQLDEISEYLDNCIS